MKSYKQLTNEVLTKSTPAGEWIKDFVDSDNPKFAGKSAAKRKQMALAAYYAKQNESAAASQNSTAEVDMREAKEHHLVHVSDGSGYDETPHEKDIEHIKTGAMHTGGEWAGHSDKGAFFKFKSKEDAEHFKRHVDKCPHRSCYADHVNEAVEYKGIGTDVVDKKKKLNPQPNLMSDKKQVKDFKEEVDESTDTAWKEHEAWANSAVKTAAKESTKRAQAATAAARKEDENDDSDQQYDAHKEAARLHKSAMKHYAKGSDDYKHHEKMAKQHHEILGEDVQIDEVSKATLMRYIPKASRDVGSHTYAGKEAGEWASHYTRAGDWSTAEKHSKKSYADFRKANKRIAGIDTATKKLGTQKEEVEHIEEATVATRKYDFGTMKTIHHGKSFSIPLHPEHHQPIAKLKHGESHSFKDETGAKWKATRDNDTVHFHGGSYGTQKTSVPHSSLHESRGHKVLATFFKNREVAQRAYQGNPAKDAEVAQGGGTPADQGIAAAKKDAEKLKKESVNPALMAILKKRQEAQKKKEEDKKKVSESKTPAVHAAEPKKTKSTAKEYTKASVPGTKRVAHAKPDDNEVGGGTATRINEDQYTSEYKIKYYVDPVTGENKTRKIRPHRVNFKASKMHGEPAQQDAPGDYGMKEGYVAEGGFDNYHEIAKELIKRHGKNVDTGHINDLAGERDTHRGLDHSEVMHHVNKILGSKEVKEGDEYDEQWKEYKGKTFKKESRMINFKDYLKEAHLSAKQKKIAAIAGDKDKIDADDLAALRAGKKPVEEAKKCMDEDDMDESGLRMAAHAAHKSGKKEFEFQGKTYPVKVQKEGVLKPELEKAFPARGVKTGASAPKGTTYMPKKDVKEEAEQIDELSKKTLGSYVNKAAKDSRIHGQIATDFENTADKARKQSKKDSFERLNRKYLEKAWKREDGIAKAVGKLTKEEVEQIDEGKMKDIYTSMMHHADKKGYTSHKQFTPADYDAVGKEHGISGKELAIIAGHKTAQQVANEAVDKVEKDASGKVKSWSHEGDWKKSTSNKEGSGRAANLAGQALKKTHQLSKEEVERIEEKLSQLDELSKKTLGSYVNRSANQAIVKSLANPKDDSDDMKTIAKREKGIRLATSKLAKEEVEQEMSPYVKGTLSVMDEGKIDDLRDAQKLRKDTQSAYSKGYKPDTSHPHIKVVKGTAYGGANQKDDEGDEKKDDEGQEKRGRGRPAGKVGKYKARGSKSVDKDIDDREFTLHLPK